MRKKTLACFQKANQLIPGGVNSPVRSAKGLLSCPLMVEKGKGSSVWDLDGNSYLDYCMSWGALILGHAHDEVIKKVVEQIQKGTSFGIATELEVAFAQKMQELIPSIEKIRLVNSGTEATMTAIRLARAFTKRKKIVKFAGHYHGHVDALLIRAGSFALSMNQEATSEGIPYEVIQDTIVLPFNDFSQLSSFFNSSLANEVACVIVEPVAANMGVVLPEEGFLEMLREKTKEHGALLIFDEVITGFRLSLEGASGSFGIRPDLRTYGKVIGGGFPLAAVAGNQEILEQLSPLGKVYQAGTLSGNPVAVSAGLATLNLLSEKHFYENLEKKAKRLADPIDAFIQKSKMPLQLQRKGSLMTLFFSSKPILSESDLSFLDHKAYQWFYQTLFEKGIYLPPSPHEAWFVSIAHSDEELDRTAQEVISALSLLPSSQISKWDSAKSTFFPSNSTR